MCVCVCVCVLRFQKHNYVFEYKKNIYVDVWGELYAGIDVA